MQRGGLIGKGGVLTADLAPSSAVREGVTETVKALRQGDYQNASRLAAGAALPTGMYAAGLGFNYGIPVVSTVRDVQQQRQEGRSGLSAIAGNAVSGGANLALNTLGVIPSMVSSAIPEGAAQKIKNVGAIQAPEYVPPEYSQDYVTGPGQMDYALDPYQNY